MSSASSPKRITHGADVTPQNPGYKMGNCRILMEE